MNTPGSTVYVRWYGRTLQGIIVPNTTPDQLLGRMVAVTIPIQGTTATALFTPAHVYDSPELASAPVPAVPEATPAPAAVPEASASGPPAPAAVGAVPVPARAAAVPEASASGLTPEVSEAALEAHRQRYRQFKAAHWDHEHNRLHVAFLEEGYQLFRQGIAMKIQLKKQTPNPATMPLNVRYTIRQTGHTAPVLTTPDRSYARLQLMAMQAKAQPGQLYALTHEVKPQPPLTKPEEYLLLVYDTRRLQRTYFDRRGTATKEESTANLKASLESETRLDQWNQRTRAYIDSHPGFEDVLKSLPPDNEKARHFAFYQVVEEWRIQWKAYFAYKKRACRGASGVSRGNEDYDPAVEREMKKQCFDLERAIDEYITKSLRL